MDPKVMDYLGIRENQPLVSKEHIERLRSDMPLYARLGLQITTRKGQLVELAFNAAQRLVNDKVERQLAETGRVRCLILKARQEGMSTFVAARIYRGCTLWGHRSGLVLADKRERAGIIFGIYERFDKHVPQPLKPPKSATRRQQEMTWKTDSRISVETAGDPEAGRGYTVQYLHASEQAMWEHAEETWTAVMQAVPLDSGEVYVESTAKGVGNLFHRLWQQAEAGQNDWLPIFLPWFVAEEYRIPPRPDEEADIVASTDEFERWAQDEGVPFEGENIKLGTDQLAWRRKKIADDFAGDERLFRQEFPATATEAFIVSGNAFFDAYALEDLARGVRVPWRGNIYLRQGGVDTRPAERGWLRVWEKPQRTGHYVIGVDTAQGKQVSAPTFEANEGRSEMWGRDFTSADVIKCCEFDGEFWMRCNRLVANYHGRMTPEVAAKELRLLGMWYSALDRGGAGRPALLAVERNHSSGQTILRYLREHYHYPNLFYNRRFNTRLRKATEFLGWVTDVQSRMPLLDGLASAIREGDIDLPSDDHIREMRTFIRDNVVGADGTPQAQEGCHDDRVISLAIAHEMTRYHTHDPEGAMPEWERADSLTGL